MIEINDINDWNTVFENHRKDKNILLINFTAAWCGPCKKLKPELEKLISNDNYKNVKFYKVDIDKCNEIVDKLKIESVPTTLLIKNDNIVERISGSNLSQIITNLDNLLKP